MPSFYAVELPIDIIARVIVMEYQLRESGLEEL